MNFGPCMNDAFWKWNMGQRENKFDNDSSQGSEVPLT